MLTVVSATNHQRTKVKMANGLSPEFVVRPLKAFRYWVLFILVGVGIIALASEMKGGYSLNLEALGFYTFLAMGLSIDYTAYVHPKL